MTRHVLPRLGKVWRYALVGSLAFSLGSAATVTAGPTISGFVGLADGDNTAAINASRELSVSDAGASGHLQNILATTDQLAFDAAGNLMTSAQGTQTVTGTVSVGNLPATQQVSGSVSVANLPATQNVAGTVSVGNFPATQNVSGTVGLSPSANTVKIDPANNGRTVLALSEIFVALVPQPPSSGDRLDRTIDVSPYERVRIFVRNHTILTAPCGGEPVINFQIVDENLIGLDQFTLRVCDQVEKVYEVPGTTLRFVAVAQSGLGARLILKVWGR